MKCWSKISQTCCKRCIFEGSQELRRGCPYHQGAIIQYDNCLIKYSNQYFLGLSDATNGLYLTNYKFVDTPLMFDRKVGPLLTKLCIHAYDSDFKVAHGELETGILHQGLIYGVDQCTSDLSSHSCKKCLNVAMTELLKNNHGRSSGRAYYGSF